MKVSHGLFWQLQCHTHIHAFTHFLIILLRHYFYTHCTLLWFSLLLFLD